MSPKKGDRVFGVKVVSRYYFHKMNKRILGRGQKKTMILTNSKSQSRLSRSSCMRKSVTGVVVCNKSVFLVELSLSSRLGLETDFSQLSSYSSLFGEAWSQGPLEVTGADWLLLDLVKKLSIE